MDIDPRYPIVLHYESTLLMWPDRKYKCYRFYYNNQITRWVDFDYNTRSILKDYTIPATMMNILNHKNFEKLHKTILPEVFKEILRREGL